MPDNGQGPNLFPLLPTVHFGEEPTNQLCGEVSHYGIIAPQDVIVDFDSNKPGVVWWEADLLEHGVKDRVRVRLLQGRGGGGEELEQLGQAEIYLQGRVNGGGELLLVTS